MISQPSPAGETAHQMEGETGFAVQIGGAMLSLARDVAVEGIGLHSGQRARVWLRPRQSAGWELARVDLPGSPTIPLGVSSVSRTQHATVLEHGTVGVSTVEHLLAALWARGVGACRIEVDGPELPILDGSALGWCRALDEAGQAALPMERPVYALREPVVVFKGESCVLGLPHPTLRASASVAFATLWDSKQSMDCDVSPSEFTRAIAPARTFTLESWVEPLQRAGLIKGGSPQNAVILDDDGPSSPWRLPGELARHKILDLLGDLSLLFAADGGTLRAHLIAIKAGHEMHRLWAREALRKHALARLEREGEGRAAAST